MPFIGTQPEIGGYSVLDALTASATASYTLQLNSANFSPSSANQLLVSLNGVIQKPGTSFTVSGSTLTFSSALTSSDSIDFILAMGEPLLVGTPSDGTINTAKLATNAVSTAKIASSAVTDAKIAGMSATKLTDTISSARLPAGSIIQVLNHDAASSTNTSSGTFTDTGANISITPSSTSNKVLVIASVAAEIYGSGSDRGIKLRLLRDSAILTTQSYNLYDSSDTSQRISQVIIKDFDSPSTTSSVNYKVQYAASGTNSTARVQNYGETSITVMEVVG